MAFLFWSLPVVMAAGVTYGTPTPSTPSPLSLANKESYEKSMLKYEAWQKMFLAQRTYKLAKDKLDAAQKQAEKSIQSGSKEDIARKNAETGQYEIKTAKHHAKKTKYVEKTARTEANPRRTVES